MVDKRVFRAARAVAPILLLCACIRMPATTGPATAPVAAKKDETVVEPFELKAEWSGPCARSEAIDVNLGNAPATFVRAAHCQVTGQEPAPAVVDKWTRRMRDEYYVRRVDVVRALCTESKRQCKLTYSDPWVAQPELTGAPERHTKRDIGAVMMFFFDCPHDTNCQMDWANTHASGMDKPVASLPTKHEGGEPGYFHPNNFGFWRQALSDAKYAGLSFLMPNAYGPDIEKHRLKPLEDALESLEDPVKIGLFDDTWTWGQQEFGGVDEFRDLWKHRPDLTDPEKAARLIFENKWKPFFKQIDKKYWYRFKGKPFIYFYNAGTLEPRTKAAPVIARLKQLFKDEFGEEPFVDVDIAFFDDPAMSEVADSKFKWMTFDMPQRRFRSQLNGHVIDHAMVRWDAINRDRPGALATKYDRCVKGGQILERVLRESQDAELLVFATWNDLGEGTGVGRNYDYYVDGRWLPPHYFMQLIRNSQRDGKR